MILFISFEITDEYESGYTVQESQVGEKFI